MAVEIVYFALSIISTNGCSGIAGAYTFLRLVEGAVATTY